MKKLGLLLGVAVLVGLGIAVFLQSRSLTEMRAENVALNAAAAEADLLKEELEQLKRTQASPEERDKARRAESELLRLRGEVAKLRDQLKAVPPANPAADAIPVPAPAEPAEPEIIPPVDTFTATVRVTLAPQQTLVTGGWRFPNGKRGIVLVEPVLIENAGAVAQVEVHTRFVEMPDDALGTLGLEALRAGGKETGGQAVYDADQAQILLKALEQLPGVNVLSAPTVSTLDGRQAQVNVVSNTDANSTAPEVGPSLSIIPKLADDGMSMNLSVIAQMRMKANPQQ